MAQRSNIEDISKSTGPGQLKLVENSERTGGYALHIDIYEYNAEELILTDNPLERRTKGVIDTLIMPIPSNITGSISASYASDEIGAVFAAGEVIGSKIRDEQAGLQGYDKFQEGLIQSFKYSPIMMEALSEKAMLAASGGEVRVKQALLGSVGNPRTLTYFNNMELRSHTFQWNIVPESAQESENAVKIINKLKRYMLPSLQAGGARFKFPELVKFHFFPSKLQKYLYTPNVSVITNVEVNYNSETGPSFFADTKAPAQINLSVTLGELVIETKETLKVHTDKFDVFGGEA